MNDNQLDTEIIVDNYQQFRDKYNRIVDDCRQVRESAGFNQLYLAEWCGVERWRIVQFESKKHLDFEMLCSVADKLDIKIELNHTIN